MKNLILRCKFLFKNPLRSCKQKFLGSRIWKYFSKILGKIPLRFCPARIAEKFNIPLNLGQQMIPKLRLRLDVAYKI